MMTIKRMVLLLSMLAIIGCTNAEKAEILPEITGTQPLEVPPGLVLPEKNNSMDIPPVNEEFKIR